ncbi:hypothetical protein [Streptomyces jumonjinensis]|uniref:hypothetical protein n=1 Tax=Streptomyces jumonjinensis TaxID=1945 RepID=UPI00378C3C1F
MTDTTGPATIRPMLTDEQYEAAVENARTISGRWAQAMGEDALAELVTAALAGAGFRTPPPAPEPGQCAAQHPDEYGIWWQCAEESGHDPSERHDAGDWSWAHDDPEEAKP